MKQFLLKTWLTMLCLLVFGSGTMWGEGSIEINTTNSGVTGSYNTTTFDVDDVTFGFTDWMKSTNIQAKKSTTNSCYNVDAIPGSIKKITVVQTGTARAIKIYGGISSKPTTEITAPSTAATMEFDFTGKNYTYFSMTTPGNAVYINTITIEYETTPTAAYTVTFNAGTNGTCSASSITESAPGAGVTLPSVTANEGYLFKGWASASGASTANAGAAGANYKPTSDCTLYAVYGNLYTVTLGDNSATLTQTTEGGNVTLPSREGNSTYTFAGWSSTNNTEETTIAPSIIAAGDYKPTENVTLYPVYNRSEGSEGYILSENVSGTTKYMKHDCSETTTKSEAEAFNWNTSTGLLTYTSGANTYYITHQTSNSTNLVNNTTVPASGKEWTITDNTNDKTVKFRSKAQTTRYLGTTGSGFKAYAASHTLNYEPAGTIYYISVLPAEKPTPELSFSSPTYNVTMGEDFATPTLTKTDGIDVTYSSSETGVATVNATTGAISLVAPGTTVITASFAGDETYKAAVARYELIVSPAKYTVTFGETQNGTITVKNGETVINSGDEVAEGTTLTIECTPTDAENYRFKNWQYKAGEAAWATRTKDFTYTMPSANVQFRANFEEIPTYTVAFSVNGATIQSNLLKEGAAVTAPENPGSIKGKVFTGWVETPSVSADATPAYVNPSTTAQNDVTYYAVFATKEGADDVTYTKVSTISDGTYLMATVTADQFISKTTLAYAGHKLNTASTPVYAWGEVTPVSITENVISTKPETAKEITITVGTGDDAKYFSMYDGESYITMADKGKFTYASSPSYEWELNSDGIHNKGIYDNASTWYIYVNNGNSGAQAEYFVPVKQKNEGNNNGNYYYYAQLFKKDGGATYSNFTTTPTPLILLDENSESTDEVVEEGVKVNVKRAIRAGYWSPLCLPFDMTEEQIADNFGDDAEVKRFSGLEVDGENYNLKFAQATTIEAGTSYMVRLQNPITEINVSDVDVCMSENIYNATTQEDFDADENVISVTFKGNYYNNTTVPEGSYIINSNKFYFVNSSVVNKGFRGYFTVANSANNSNKAVKLNFSFDDILTGIEGITVEGLDNNIFDLQGRRVQRLQKGVNIVNGKKVLR